MDLLLLAQGRDAGDWLNFIIMLLVIGGSIFGAVAKKLIEFFRDKKSAEGELDIEIDDKIEPVSPARRVQPSAPVARPMPPRGSSSTAPARPTAQPLPARPLQPTLTPDTPAGPARPLAPPAARKPTTRPAPVPPAAPAQIRRIDQPQSPPPARTAPRPRPAPSIPSRPVQARPAASAKRPPRKRRRERGEEKFDHLDPEKKLGHLEHLEGTLTEKPARKRPSDKDKSLSWTSPAALRHAIVMKEVLGPPLALRAWDDPSSMP